MAEIISFFKQLFGIGIADSSVFQVVARSFVMYILGIVMVRIGKKRFIGKMTAFDTILAVMVGSLLSWGIVDADLFVAINVVSVFLIILHALFSMLAATSDKFDRMINGKERIVIRNGVIIREALRKSNLSEKDLMQALRLNAHTTDVSKVKIARLERNGDISILMKEEETG